MKLTKKQMYLNMVKQGNIEALQSYLEDDVLKEYSFKKFLKEFFNKYNKQVHGYFSIDNHMFISDNFSLIRISDSVQKLSLIKNYKELPKCNSLVTILTKMVTEFETKIHCSQEINIFDYVNITTYSDVNSTVEMSISDTQDIKISMNKLFMLSSIIGDKKINIILPNDRLKPIWIDDKLGNPIGFILPIR